MLGELQVEWVCKWVVGGFGWEEEMGLEGVLEEEEAVCEKKKKKKKKEKN